MPLQPRTLAAKIKLDVFGICSCVLACVIDDVFLCESERVCLSVSLPVLIVLFITCSAI